MRRTALVALVLILAVSAASAQVTGPAADAVQRAASLNRDGRYEDARKALAPFVKTHPDDTGVRREYARALGGKRRFADATRELQYAHGLAPEDPGILFDLSAVLYNQARYDEALMPIRELESLTGLQLNDRMRAYISYMRGLCAKELELLPEAIASLRQAVDLAPERDPRKIEYMVELGGILLNSGRYEPAAAAFRQALALQPANPDHHYHLGVCLLQSGAFDAAQEELSEARRLDPKNHRISQRLGKLAMRRKEFDLAFSYYYEATENNPLADEAWHALGQLARLRGDDASARQFLERYQQVQKLVHEAEETGRRLNRRTKRNPDDVDAWLEHGIFLLQNDKKDEAMAKFQRLLAVDPDHEIGILNMSALLASMGHFDDAYWELQKLLERKPENPFANLDTGRVLMFLVCTPAFRSSVVAAAEPAGRAGLPGTQVLAGGSSGPGPMRL